MLRYGWLGGALLTGVVLASCVLWWFDTGQLLQPQALAEELRGAGLTAMSARAFLLATAIGMVPMTALFVVAGMTLTIDPYWAALGGVLLVVLLLGIPRLIERVRPDVIEAMHTNGDHRMRSANPLD
ncbi:MAG: hypothetical protein EA417_05460 [Gammaproteobacteria bacterium]|nr:MAG: hypothetical protein EA417_05460 [Gammaproteobacteria bacterium]